QSPFSGRHAVWVRAMVQEERAVNRKAHWAMLVDEQDGRPFLVDDGSGDLARVIPTRATFVLERQLVAKSGTFRDAAPHLQAFLGARGHATTTWLGFNKPIRYDEEVVAPEDAIFVLGPAQREATSGELVMYATPGPQGELIVTTRGEGKLTS